MLGYFDGSLTDLIQAPDKDITHSLNKDITPNHFRMHNRFLAQNAAESKNNGISLIKDLKSIIEHVQPSIIVVTHPEIDPHPDHIATAKACAWALQQSQHKPEYIFMYANHIRKARGFPWGPVHSAAGVWPWNKNESLLGEWGLYSEYLCEDLQKEKVIAFNIMHDLQADLKFKKRLKRLKKRYLTGVPLNLWKNYGEHKYFQTQIKAHELFAYVSSDAFITGTLNIY